MSSGLLNTLGALALCAAFAFTAAGCKSKPDLPAHNPDGALPTGCSVVAQLRPDRLGQAGAALSRLLSAPVGGVQIPGLDLSSGFAELSLCRLGPGSSKDAKAPAHAPFVIGVRGGLQADFMSKLAELQHQTLEPDPALGVPVLGRDKLWLARRGVRGESGELVIASDRDALRATLAGPPGAYAGDAASPFFVILGHDELAHITSLASAGAVDPNGARLDAREVRLSLSPAQDSLSVRFVLEDAAAAQALAPRVRPVLEAVARQITGGTSAASSLSETAVSVVVEGKDVLARVPLPPGSVGSLLERATALKGRIGFSRAARPGQSG
jgi:hypothetical protein